MFPKTLSGSKFWTTWLRLCVLLNNNHNNCCCLFTSRMTTTFQSNKNEKLGIGSHLQKVEKIEVLQESPPKSEEIFCRGGLYKLIFQVKDKLHTTTAHKNISIFQYQISITIHVLLYSWSNPATLSESPPSAFFLHSLFPAKKNN